MVVLDSTNTEIFVSGSGDLWGTWFFTNQWKLYINIGSEGHAIAAKSLGVESCDVILYGHFNRDHVVIADEFAWELKRSVVSLLKIALRKLMK